MKNIIIPALKKGRLTEVDNLKTIDIFYGFNNRDDKIKNIELIRKNMSKHENFIIYEDFLQNIILGMKEWNYNEDVMIYENKDTTEINKVLIDGYGSYECVLWMSSKKS